MDSGFNIGLTGNFNEEFIEIGNSSRYRYYKTRRNGIWHFVKTPKPDFEGDLITSEALKKEFLIGYGLNHPSVVRYYAYEDGKLYEEYIEGKTLREMIDGDDPRISDPYFIEGVTSQILEALDYLHSRGVSHLDLKPENIMITQIGGRAKIIDFSCAESAELDSTPGFTEAYMAPEQITGQINDSTEIYQVGKIVEELVQASGKGRKWRKFISKATSNHPDNRFENARKALAAIPAGNNNYSVWIEGFMFIFLITGAVFFYLATENHRESAVEIPAINPVQETKIEEGSNSREEPAPELIPTTSPIPAKPSRADIERKLTDLINRHLDSLFSIKVTPMYEKMMEDSVNRRDLDRAFIQAYSQDLDQLVIYGDELIKEYPDYRAFIEERVVKTFESKTSMMRLRLYPSE